MTRQLSAATAVCSGPATSIVHQTGATPTALPDAGGSEGEPDVLLLRTVEEDTVWLAGNSSIGCDSLHGFTPCPTSFLAGEGYALRRTASERVMKRDKDVPRSREGDGQLAIDGGDFLSSGRPPSLYIATPTTAGQVVEGEFPELIRRRTFTETASSSSVDERNDCSVRGGRVPMSMSEDNMLALLARHPPSSRSPPGTRQVTAVQDDKWPALKSPEQATFFSERTAGRPGTGTGIASSNPSGAATSRARQNSVVMKLHRASLIEDACRCVVDIAEGRAAAAAEEAREQMGAVAAGHQALPAATIEEVKAHFKSLPRRYGLSVEPADALTHMKVLKEAAESASTSSQVRVFVHPQSSPSVQSETPGRFGGFAGDGGEGGRCRVLVVCRHSPFLLGAISSALRSAECTCLDADVMTTTNGMSMARIEVEGNSRIAHQGSRPRDDEHDAPRTPAATPHPPHHPLTDFLSSGIARALAAAAAAGAAAGDGVNRVEEEALVTVLRDGGLHQLELTGDGSTGSDSGSDDLSAPLKKARATDSADYGSVAASPLPMEARQVNSLPPAPEAVQPGELGDAAAAAASASSADSTSATEGVPGGAGGVVGRTGCHGRRRVKKRLPLARREGCSSLAETDATALSGNGLFSANEGVNDTDAFRGGGGDSSSGGGGDSFSGGGGGGGDVQQYPLDDECIAPEDIQLLELVEEGRFNRLHRGRWRGSTVAVKTVELPADASLDETEGATTSSCGVRLPARSEGRRHVMTEFERELHVVRRLNHPNICGYLGVCIAEPHLSLVYEFLENGTLGDRLRNKTRRRPGVVTAKSKGCGGTNGAENRTANGCGGSDGSASSSSSLQPQPLTSADLLRIVAEVAEGMRYLHEMGVLHRDLKPDNIMLDAGDGARIADFGLSCFCNPSKEHTAETGTYRWMAPEVIRHEPYSQSADVYSYGVVLWEVLTRRQPFEGLTPIQAAFSVAHQGFRPRLPPGTPSALGSLIRQCWHPTPDSRPSFAEVCSALPEVKAQIIGNAWPS